MPISNTPKSQISFHVKSWQKTHSNTLCCNQSWTESLLRLRPVEQLLSTQQDKGGWNGVGHKYANFQRLFEREPITSMYRAPGKYPVEHEDGGKEWGVCPGERILT